MQPGEMVLAATNQQPECLAFALDSAPELKKRFPDFFSAEKSEMTLYVMASQPIPM